MRFFRWSGGMSDRKSDALISRIYFTGIDISLACLSGNLYIKFNAQQVSLHRKWYRWVNCQKIQFTSVAVVVFNSFGVIWALHLKCGSHCHLLKGNVSLQYIGCTRPFEDRTCFSCEMFVFLLFFYLLVLLIHLYTVNILPHWLWLWFSIKTEFEVLLT